MFDFKIKVPGRNQLEVHVDKIAADEDYMSCRLRLTKKDETTIVFLNENLDGGGEIPINEGNRFWSPEGGEQRKTWETALRQLVDFKNADAWYEDGEGRALMQQIYDEVCSGYEASVRQAQG